MISSSVYTPGGDRTHQREAYGRSIYWELPLLRRYLPLLTVFLSTACFYLYQLDGVGVLDPDEPRYAAIGQAMARTGDWITPRLWGSPWFEKPPLVYWLSAVFHPLGLSPETTARLPIALLSLAFLLSMFILLRREFGSEVALVSVSVLATSAGWVAYSSLMLTDLPLAVFFSLAVLLALPLLRAQPDTDRILLRFAAIGVCLGLAALAKGLVPFVLVLPSFWFLRRYWRAWWAAGAACLAVAAPWYTAVYLRNGEVFIDEFFLKHHFQRIYSSSLQHVQPWYFYVPVLVGALFPWIPLFAVFLRRRVAWDQRRSFLLATAAFGVLFFSASLNKLPGYLLPLLPSLAALLGAEFETTSFASLRRGWFVSVGVLIACIPLIARGLPDALAAGRITALHFGSISATQVFFIAAPLAVAIWSRRSWTCVLLALTAVAAGLFLKASAYPALDSNVSARGLWRELSAKQGTVCDGGVNRTWVYGLSFYLGRQIPPCGNGVFDFELRANGRERPVIVARRRL